MIFANSSTRKLTSAEIGEQAERVEALLYQLKEDGFEFPEGRMRDVVAAACNTHGSKLARIKVIREHLLSNLRPAWDGGKMPEQAAYALAQFPADMQMRISGVFPQLPTGSTLEKLLRLYKDRGYRWEPRLTCPDGKECKRGDAFLRHDAECCGCDVCGGQTCCLECSQGTATYYPCDEACSKAKAKRKEALAEKKVAKRRLRTSKCGNLRRKFRPAPPDWPERRTPPEYRTMPSLFRPDTGVLILRAISASWPLGSLMNIVSTQTILPRITLVTLPSPPGRYTVPPTTSWA